MALTPHKRRFLFLSVDRYYYRRTQLVKLKKSADSGYPAPTDTQPMYLMLREHHRNIKESDTSMVSYIPHWLVNFIFSNDREPAPMTAQQFIYLDKTSTMTGQTDMQGEW